MCDITIPNVFTLNGDSQNNSLVIEGLLNFRNSTIKIYNRWGTLVYENDDYRNNWSPDEQQAEDGVYYYILGINKPTGMEYHASWINIMR
ncbi:MAG: gliding motility-associated C-terminal domain-containing protein [Flavobacteriales bacterium]